MSARRKNHESAGRLVVLGLPYLWLLAFFLAPFALVLKVALSQSTLGRPPYVPVFDTLDLASLSRKLQELSLDAFARLASDQLYLDAYLGSLALAAAATLVTLVLAFPMALAIARSDARLRPLLLVLVIAPFWTSALVRIYAFIMILKDEGLLNQALRGLGLIDAPLHIFATNSAVLIGIVYAYFPFMVLPLFAALDSEDKTLREAAADLGAAPLQVLARITLPLAVPGIAAGSLMVFIPAVGEFVIPDLLGGSGTLMIGTVLWSDFFANRDWPAAAAAAVVLLVLLAGPLVLYERLQAKDGALGPKDSS
jgi:putrescine transport system permease protein